MLKGRRSTVLDLNRRNWVIEIMDGCLLRLTEAGGTKKSIHISVFVYFELPSMNNSNS